MRMLNGRIALARDILIWGGCVSTLLAAWTLTAAPRKPAVDPAPPPDETDERAPLLGEPQGGRASKRGKDDANPLGLNVGFALDGAAVISRYSPVIPVSRSGLGFGTGLQADLLVAGWLGVEAGGMYRWNRIGFFSPQIRYEEIAFPLGMKLVLPGTKSVYYTVGFGAVYFNELRAYTNSTVAEQKKIDLRAPDLASGLAWRAKLGVMQNHYPGENLCTTLELGFEYAERGAGTIAREVFVHYGISYMFLR